MVYCGVFEDGGKVRAIIYSGEQAGKKKKRQVILQKLCLKYLEELEVETKGLLKEGEKTNLKKMMR